ncbi:hypothetical protein G4177_06020 [Corallococcus sp. ZKHCc1 1396]|uniref:Uncharacterized protein n=1 Tax=Corallococcus soli TaxID=2710757 RepID=A0ABR9PIK2_9BACT|nr:hypothetical protein [Corallococcus soli]MBE4747734.1 hypothetical protein [Corallococcus soli]
MGETTKDATAGRLEAIRARHAAASRGPWRWFGYLSNRGVGLEGPGITVMEFTRWGMSGAQPLFSVKGILHKLAELVVPDTAVGRGRVTDINHPDARFIAASWQDVQDLLGMVDAQRDLLSELLRIGGQFSNVAYNVTQRAAPLAMSEHEREVLKQLQVAWDVRVREVPHG